MLYSLCGERDRRATQATPALGEAEIHQETKSQNGIERNKASDEIVPLKQGLFCISHAGSADSWLIGKTQNYVVRVKFTCLRFTESEQDASECR